MSSALLMRTQARQMGTHASREVFLGPNIICSNGDCDDDSSLQRSVLLSPDSQEEELKVKVLNGNGEVGDDDDRRKTCNGMLEDKTELYSTSKTAIRASFGHQVT